MRLFSQQQAAHIACHASVCLSVCSVPAFNSTRSSAVADKLCDAPYYVTLSGPAFASAGPLAPPGLRPRIQLPLPLPFPPLPFPYLLLSSLPLKVDPLNPARGSWEAS